MEFCYTLKAQKKQPQHVQTCEISVKRVTSAPLVSERVIPSQPELDKEMEAQLFLLPPKADFGSFLPRMEHKSRILCISSSSIRLSCVLLN